MATGSNERNERLARLAKRLGASARTVAGFARDDGRLSIDSPAYWQDYSARLLERWRPLQKEVLSALGWEHPVAPADLGAILRARLSEGDYYGRDKGKGGYTLRLPDDAFPFTWPAADPASSPVFSSVRRMCDTLGCPERDAVGYLLCDHPFVLPWLAVEWHWFPSTGFRFTIDVASADVTGKEVASAYTTAIKAALGATRSKRLERPTQMLDLVLHDLDGRAKGLSAEQRWEGWKAVAAARNYTTYDGDPDYPKNGLYSYRETVRRQVKKMDWLVDLFALELADSDSDESDDAKGGETHDT